MISLGHHTCVAYRTTDAWKWVFKDVTQSWGWDDVTNCGCEADVLRYTLWSVTPRQLAVCIICALVLFLRCLEKSTVYTFCRSLSFQRQYYYRYWDSRNEGDQALNKSKYLQLNRLLLKANAWIFITWILHKSYSAVAVFLFCTGSIVNFFIPSKNIREFTVGWIVLSEWRILFPE